MKILFISDIHGITNNLIIIDNIMKEKKIDKLVCLGDLYHAGLIFDNKLNINSNYVLEFLNKYSDRLICIKGNCDTFDDIKLSSFPIYQGLYEINVDNLKIFLTHGNEYNIYNNNYLKDGILIYGHEHIPYIKKNDNMIYINVGSISLPRNGNNPTYAIYDNKNVSIYDIYGNIIDSINLN